MSPVKPITPQHTPVPVMEHDAHSIRCRRTICLCLVALVLLGALLAFRFHYQLTLVKGPSMQPTFHTGDLLLVDQKGYRELSPSRGDIVVARYQGDLIVKRIVGLPGERIEVIAGKLYVNGKAVLEEYTTRPGSLNVGEGVLAPGKYALLGDNRDRPASVLVHGVVAQKQIVGQVIGTVPLGTDVLGLISGPET